MTVTEEPTTAATPTANDETKTSVDSMVVQEGSADAETEENQPDKAGKIKKILIFAALLALIIFVVVDTQTNNYVLNAILSFLNWIEENVVWGVLVFIFVYFLATIFFIPGSILTLGAGFVFSAALDNNLWLGVALGTAAVFVGASTGAIAAFLLGRYLFRDCCVGAITERFKIFKAIDNALTNNGLKIMILLRLSPIIPFNFLNYGAGVTGVQFWHYALACFGMLPGTVLYVFLGASAGSLLEIAGLEDDDEEGSEDIEDEEGSSRTLTIVFAVVGIIFGVVAVGFTSYYAKQELNKVLENEEGEGNDEGEGDEEQQGNVAEGKSDDQSM